MNDVEAIKQRLDIIDVAREYLTLKQAGAHFKACCPFHHEKTPSFMLNRERQMWHCFGCNEGGDVFSFVQRIENIDFREALRLLAEKAGYELTTGQRAEIHKNERARLMDLLALAANVYHKIFCDVAPAHGAREYIARRGVNAEMIAQFQIGFSPTGWDVMTQYLLKKGFSIEDCARAGLTIVKQDSRTKYFDRFRGRIMFPIGDTHGRVIGFTGRLLFDNPDAGGKYVNTPETPLFHKGTLVYALHLAKQAIKDARYVVLVEGQMDVIACHQSGMKNVVACSGTALTLEQLRLLKRYTDELRMAFDADAAGQHAAERSIQAALAEGFVVKIIDLPSGAGKDADECIKKNPDVWNEAVASARPFMEHLMHHLVPEGERTSIRTDARRKHELSQKISHFIALIPSNIERDHWVQQASMHIGVTPDAFAELVKRVRAGAPTASASVPEQAPTTRHPMRTMLEERLMAVLQVEFSLLSEVTVALPDDAILDASYRALYKEWRTQYTSVQTPHGAPITDPTLDLLFSAVYTELGQKERQEELRSLVKRLREIYINEQREMIAREIHLAEAAGNFDQVNQLLKHIQALIV